MTFKVIVCVLYVKKKGAMSCVAHVTNMVGKMEISS